MVLKSSRIRNPQPDIYSPQLRARSLPLPLTAIFASHSDLRDTLPIHFICTKYSVLSEIIVSIRRSTGIIYTLTPRSPHPVYKTEMEFMLPCRRLPLNYT